ncbi:type II toxin-antitoxin system Phd/YefM family antitoxin [Geminocystis herdmanii]|uniref:type II toxin-antitoxin system Phd/YefM family antitoxin n=1 Tax=Geminocystis herdmanii TaxID=669359 RepID=UPI0003457B41|nr:type II toxin-antitoxin system Phd/YefM family antitoxin [Geminocystis herdmanii]
MINLSRDIQSLSTFKRNTNDLISQIKETGSPMILTVNGKAEIVVQDAISYQQLLDKIDRLETMLEIQKGLADVKQGNTQSLDSFIKEMETKHDISG